MSCGQLNLLRYLRLASVRKGCNDPSWPSATCRHDCDVGNLEAVGSLDCCQGGCGPPADDCNRLLGRGVSDQKSWNSAAHLE